jgi:hypothetical protein
MIGRRIIQAVLAASTVTAALVAPAATGVAQASDPTIYVRCSAWGLAANTKQIAFPVKKSSEATFYVQTCIYLKDNGGGDTDYYRPEVEIVILDGDSDFPYATSDPNSWAFNAFNVHVSLQVNNQNLNLTGTGLSYCNPDARNAIDTGGPAEWTSLNPYTCSFDSQLWTKVKAGYSVTADGYITYDVNDDGNGLLPTWNLTGSPSFSS